MERRRVNVRAHTRRWPKRWDERKFIVEVTARNGNIEQYVVLARSALDAEEKWSDQFGRVQKGEKLVVYSFDVNRILAHMDLWNTGAIQVETQYRIVKGGKRAG